MAHPCIHKRKRDDGDSNTHRRRVPRPFIRSEIDPRTESDDIIDRTIAVWQNHTQRPLSREDGREIIENMTGFFRTLSAWEQMDFVKTCAEQLRTSRPGTRCKS